MRLKIVTHYHKDDTEFDGDYSYIEVFCNRELVRTFGDYYHDKGAEKLEGFIEGIKFVVQHQRNIESIVNSVEDIEIKHESVADDCF